MPKVSIIMGVYNTPDEEMLSLAVNSIINQTYSNWEFIICDDGSTDNTWDILCKLATQDSRIVLIKNEKNMGLAATLNNCINVSNGEYIARQDADDYSEVNRFEKQVEFLESNLEYSIVGSRANVFDDKKIWSVRGKEGRVENRDFLFGTPFLHPTVMMRKADLVKCEGYKVSRETLRTEDYDLFMRMYAAGMRGYNLSECLFYYREDREAYNKRKYRYRIDEAIVRYKGFKTLKLMPIGLLYVLKPLIIGLIPATCMHYLKNKWNSQH
ncbi:MULTISPECIES: glycosyltransferase family 2 protein [Bacillus]|uniref:glycosyltransferase family 2 protein n=1 Tax=Bacillus TaxID=1386 RepID=UPI001E436704|nr:MULTISPECIES: glycosyltransferase [Bacillus cereus group]MCC2412739.1 glycosyltransferase [Bacillus paranthracis]MDA1896223.1 glycosyltransferase [Bacillus cereus group sp. BcHK28]HDR7894654.1 glycosyltransferase [Bacillus pacificus]